MAGPFEVRPVPEERDKKSRQGDLAALFIDPLVPANAGTRMEWRGRPLDQRRASPIIRSLFSIWV
ncbi:MAG TPA: hypothetical protein VF495_18325, partial [Phenylobacterium sp.]